MKFLKFPLILFLLLLSASAAHAQFPCTNTPNLRLWLPPIGNTSVWGQCLNSDFTMLDGLLGGYGNLAVSTSSPTVAGYTNWLTGNVANVTISAFTYGYPGKSIQIFCGANDIYTSIASSLDISLASSPWTCSSSTDAIGLTLIGTKWVETWRQGGGGGGGGGGGRGGGPNYAQSFTSVTSVTLLGTSHQLQTSHLVVQCYDNAAVANAISGFGYTVNTTTFDVTVTFAIAQSGYCVVNGSGPAIFAQTETSAQTWSIPATTHNLGPNLQVSTYDSNGNRLEPAGVIVDSSGNVTVNWAIAQAGKAVLTQ
jgi:hypothetical protein